MAVEAAFHALEERLRTLRSAFRALRVIAVEDRPQGGDSALLDAMEDAVEDILGWTREALGAAARGCAAITSFMDVDQARRALTAAQELLDRIGQRLTYDLLSYERLTELATLGEERGGEWVGWAETMNGTLDGCRKPLYDTGQAVLLCWQELTEKLMMVPISVNAVNVREPFGGPGRVHPARTGARQAPQQGEGDRVSGTHEGVTTQIGEGK